MWRSTEWPAAVFPGRQGRSDRPRPRAVPILVAGPCRRRPLHASGLGFVLVPGCGPLSCHSLPLRRGWHPWPPGMRTSARWSKGRPSASPPGTPRSAARDAADDRVRAAGPVVEAPAMGSRPGRKNVVKLLVIGLVRSSYLGLGRLLADEEPTHEMGASHPHRARVVGPACGQHSGASSGGRPRRRRRWPRGSNDLAQAPIAGHPRLMIRAWSGPSQRPTIVAATFRVYCQYGPWGWGGSAMHLRRTGHPATIDAARGCRQVMGRLPMTIWRCRALVVRNNPRGHGGRPAGH